MRGNVHEAPVAPWEELMLVCPTCGGAVERGPRAVYCSPKCQLRAEKKRHGERHKERLSADHAKRTRANKSVEILQAYVRQLGVVVYDGRPLKVVRADGSTVPGNSRALLVELLRKENIVSQGLPARSRVGTLAKLLFLCLPRDQWISLSDIDAALGSQESSQLLGRSMVRAGFARPSASIARWRWHEWSPPNKNDPNKNDLIEPLICADCDKRLKAYSKNRRHKMSAQEICGARRCQPCAMIRVWASPQYRASIMPSREARRRPLPMLKWEP